MRLKSCPGLGQAILGESVTSSTEGLAGPTRRPPSMEPHRHPQEGRLLHRGVTVERARWGGRR